LSEERLRHAKELANTEPDEALILCNDVLNEHFDDPMGQKALFISAYIMQQAERWGLAYSLYERCAQLRPDISEIYSNMGMCLEEHDPDKARECFRHASTLNPKNPHPLANEGLMCLQTGDPQGCIDLSGQALALKPDLRAAQHNMGLAQIMLKQWPEGWKNYFDTLGVKHRERRDYGVPDWNGEKGTVVVYGEQGVGDEIMFASCLRDLAKTNDIILDCDGRLEGLFKRSFDFPVYGTRFKTETPLLDNHTPDYQCAIGQLPHFYRNTPEDFPWEGYLTPDPERSLQWRALFDTFKGRKIGLAWTGGLPNTGKKKRSIELSDMKTILNDKDTFISLEYKPVSEDLGDIKTYPRATAKGGDIDDLAALVGELDAVITVCTTVVYIAGALGIPCYVLVPDQPGYRYGIEGDFPWYGSVTLIRQDGSWQETLETLDL